MILIFFIGSNSSLFESKIVNGLDEDHNSALTYMVTILERNVDYPIVGMGSFYNRKFVITSMKCAKLIRGNETNFKVQGGLIVGHRPLSIRNAYYQNYENPKETLAYGILQVSHEF